MAESDPSPPWTFKIGGDMAVHRLGFGAMRITGPGIWGEPADRAEAIRTLQRARDLGIDFIDTADAYGPDVSERLIREALHPYGNVRIATKAGLARTGPERWVPLGRPEYLVQQAHKSLRNLGVEQIDLWQLHRIDPKVPADEQFGTVKELLDRGLIRHAGLSEVSVRNIKAASKHFKVATVQNRYNLGERGSDDVLGYCAERAIGFIPWYPLAAGALARAGGAQQEIDKLAKRHGATQSQIVLAWTLRKSPVMLPIPGTSRVDHLEENVAAARIVLSDAEMATLDALPRGA
jgi:pyridoxine 4-dehydrogenase